MTNDSEVKQFPLSSLSVKKGFEQVELTSDFAQF